MSVKVLEREQVVAPDEGLAILESQVLRNAQAELGYHGGSLAGQGAEWERKRAQVLDAAQVKPFTTASVGKYKSRMEWGDVRRYAAKWVGSWTVVLAASIYGCINLNDPWFALGSMGIVAAIIGIVVSAIRMFDYAPEWRQAEIQNYIQPIPTFALMTAMAVQREARKAGLSCTVYVDFLLDRQAVKERRQRERARAAELRAADPFIFVRLQGKDYYLEVWDEPGFERERVV